MASEAMESPTNDDLSRLLAVAKMVCSTELSWVQKSHVLRQLTVAVRPHNLQPASVRERVLRQVIDLGVVDSAIHLVEIGDEMIATAACDFLVDISFGSDIAAQAVLNDFTRIAARFERLFEPQMWEQSDLLHSAVTLCMNLAATRHEGHGLIVPLVQPVCLQIIRSDRCMHELRGNAITLLANLSMTVSSELRSLRVANVLLDLLTGPPTSDIAKSVAESVVIYLHGHEACHEVDSLMTMNVVEDYIAPLMASTLRAQEFRGMYPYLVYTARVFQILTRTREYAEALMAHDMILPLLLEVFEDDSQSVSWPVESDLEGRCMILEALAWIAHYKLWPRTDPRCKKFVDQQLPKLCQACNSDVRASAAHLWANLNVSHIISCLLIANRQDFAMGIHQGFWKERILTYNYPFLAS
eukprot:TRINITY_DN56404_c0_g1_i1.p1 TRINITY_DN56404_c0_g1~~TRINITY_DN56404_c0_g1_i1.p1  ORF type:complete len:433 (-),score=28.33 TRINITY_DN56404_c0_g1_i1:48-1286(-)